MISVHSVFGRFLFYTAAIVPLLTSCEFIANIITPEEEDAAIVLSSPKTLEAAPEGETFLVDFSSSQSWTSEFTFTSDEKWMSVDKSSGTKGEFTIKLKVEPNKTGKSRKASLSLSSSDIAVTVTVNQKPMDAPGEDDKSFRILSEDAKISASGGLVEVDVIPGEGYTITISVDWIREVESKASNEVTHVFEVDANKTVEERSGVISFCSGGSCIPYTVTQAAGDGNQDEGEDDGDGDKDDGEDDGEDDGGKWLGEVETGWENSSFHHRSVAMRFTADLCGFCPMMAEAFDQAKEYFSSNLEVISMHCDGGLEYDPLNRLAKKYGVSDYPTGVVDGWQTVENNEVSVTVQKTIDAVKLTEKTFTPQTGMGWKVALDGRNLKVYLAAYVKDAGKYKITVMAVEDGIVGYQNGKGNSYVHNGVPRIALSDISGDEFTASANDVAKLTFSAAIPSGCNLDNMRIVAYIQRPLGKDADKASGDFGGYFIDNSAASYIDEDRSLVLAGSSGTEDIIQGDDINLK